jgi:hypothetical protein
MNAITVSKQIWTVARHTITQALRMKIVLVIVAFLAVLLLAMPFLLEADQTRVGQVRMVITYSLYLIAFLMAVMTLFLSVAVLWNEIKGRQILILDPKPMARMTLLTGKWLGVMLINAGLLAVLLTLTYLLIHFYLGRRRPDESDYSWDSFRTQIFYATSVKRPPQPDDLDERVEAAVQKKIENDQIPPGHSVEWVRKQTRAQILKGAWQVGPGDSMTWTIRGVPKPKGAEWIQVRFRHYALVKRDRPKIMGRFVINPEGSPVVYVPPRPKSEQDYQRMRRADTDLIGLGGELYRLWKANKSSRVPHTFSVPSSVVEEGPNPHSSADNTVTIQYYNVDPYGTVAHIPYWEGVEVHYRVCGLAANMARGGWVVLCQLGIVAAFGLFFATFLGYPVAVLATVTVYIVSQLQVFISSHIIGKLYIFGAADQPPWARLEQGDVLTRSMLSTICRVVFPNIYPANLVEHVILGRVIATPMLFGAFVDLVIIRATVVGLLAWWIFRRRQLAIFSSNA